ncbi:hypothetical protein ACFZAM_02970 [Streptomyces sp. NPDC008079]|uniref:hypothetical protein n=1 Tax=Streptomyces sp. NPDC008079 TaxID=3364806 RepID=UPI0036F00F71
MSTATRTPAGTCVRCQEPVPAGQGVLVQVDQGTAAAPDVLIHKRYCQPAPVRRSNG